MISSCLLVPTAILASSHTAVVQYVQLDKARVLQPVQRLEFLKGAECPFNSSSSFNFVQQGLREHAVACVHACACLPQWDGELPRWNPRGLSSDRLAHMSSRQCKLELATTPCALVQRTCCSRTHTKLDTRARPQQANRALCRSLRSTMRQPSSFQSPKRRSLSCQRLPPRAQHSSSPSLSSAPYSCPTTISARTSSAASSSVRSPLSSSQRLSVCCKHC
jgi:hypothetical protein